MSTAIRVFAFLVVCCCLSNADKAPIYGMESPTRIPEDFILVIEFIEGLGLNHQMALFINDVLAATEFRAMTKDTYFLPPFLAARMSITDEDLALILDHPILKYAQANDKIYAQDTEDTENEIDECLERKTGIEAWALSRILYQIKPDYTTSTFKYFENTGDGVEVYVMDTGIDPDHAFLESRVKQAFIATKNDALQAEGPYDLNGHGTHTAGLITGKDYGVAMKADLINVKVLGSNGEGTIADAIRGLQFIYDDYQSKKLGKGDQAMATVHIGFGTTLPAPGLDEAVKMLVDGNQAYPLELVVIAPAGNYFGDASMVSPARSESVITVGATNMMDEILAASNAGGSVDIFAPGSCIASAWIEKDSPVMTKSGTSTAAAIVTGAHAYHLSRKSSYPSLAHLLFKDHLINVATPDVINLNPSGPAGKLNQMLPDTPNLFLYLEGCSQQIDEDDLDEAFVEDDLKAVVEDDLDEAVVEDGQ